MTGPQTLQAPAGVIYQGNALDVLPVIPGNSVHACITSPPYWGLRNYKTEPYDWGDWVGELGREPTPDLYVSHLVRVMREVGRVLRQDGTLWLNIADSYIGSGKGLGCKDGIHGKAVYTDEDIAPTDWSKVDLPYKNMALIPARLVLALQADGWIVRRDVIWYKENAMPENVLDRPSSAHEYLYMLTRQGRYYYDHHAVKEPYTNPLNRWGGDAIKDDPQNKAALVELAKAATITRPGRNMRPDAAGRNRRSVWVINTVPYGGAHYATFPPALPEICIKASTSARGCCSACGAQYVRKVERINGGNGGINDKDWRVDAEERGLEVDTRTARKRYGLDHRKPEDKQSAYRTLGWEPACSCNAEVAKPVVLDPFFGHGTTGLMARRLDRAYVGIELNPLDCKAAKSRIEGDFIRETLGRHAEVVKDDQLILEFGW